MRSSHVETRSERAVLPAVGTPGKAEDLIALRRRILTIGAAVFPALIAFSAVVFESRLTLWAKGRESVLPLAVFLLLAALLQPIVRQLIVISLCYGVSFLALRDMWQARHYVLPPPFNYVFLEQGRMAALFLVAALAATAAIGETIQPGTVWARRCYFGAAALYFTGLGVLNFFWHGSWQSLVLCGTGIISFLGCLFADRLIASEEEEPVETDDEEAQHEREEAHRRALMAKEWQEPSGEEGAHNLGSA